MKLALRLFVSAVTFAASAVLASVPSACSSAEDGTSGKRILLDVKVASPEARDGFTNALGWKVTFEKAYVATGALYYFDGATIFSLRAPHPSPPPFFGIRSAFAHPGHYVPGNAKGEYLAGSSADLRIETMLGTGNGVSGPTRSATFSFQAPAAGPHAAELGAHVAVFVGAATKGGETRAFRAEIDAADVANTKNAPSVEGCPFVETDMQADGVVTVTLKPSLWFDQVDFALVPKGDGASPVLLAPDEAPRKALARGMKAGLGYVFSYTAR